MEEPSLPFCIAQECTTPSAAVRNSWPPLDETATRSDSDTPSVITLGTCTSSTSRQTLSTSSGEESSRMTTFLLEVASATLIEAPSATPTSTTAADNSPAGNLGNLKARHWAWLLVL